MKQELLELLDDPEVIEKLLTVVATKKKHHIPPVDEKKIAKVLNYWYNLTGERIVDPPLYNKMDVLKALNSKGYNNIKSILDRAYTSPLNEDKGNLMCQYLSNLFWIIKPPNLEKIEKGNYDNDYSNKGNIYQNNLNKKTAEDDEVFTN